MGLRLQYRRYRLPLRTPIRTAHERWTEREGIIVRLDDEHGRRGFGEVAPIPAFGTETVADATAVLGRLGESPTDRELTELPTHLPCVCQALASARFEIAPAENTERAENPPREGAGVAPTVGADEASAHRPVAALLPAGRSALEHVAVKAEAGFRIFKWKVGVAEIGDEIGMLDELCAALPSGAKLRLDANGAWNRRQAEQWLEVCAERPVEFVEQPCLAATTDTDGARRRIADTLLGLAHDYPTPIALDESVVSAGDVDRWLSLGWPGWFVIKPSLLGNGDTALRRLRTARATVVFSSALETAVGAKAALRIAFGWPGEPKALGFGVWPLFADPRFDGPATGPFLRREDGEKLNSETIWNALS